MRNKQKGFALVLSLVLLLAMSLMGGALIVIASSDHQGNNSSDEYQQTFYVAETALLQAEKSLLDKLMGPINDTNGVRDTASRSIPINTVSINPDNYNHRSDFTPCYKSFRNLIREFDPNASATPPQNGDNNDAGGGDNSGDAQQDQVDGNDGGDGGESAPVEETPDFRLVEHVENQSFFALISPLFADGNRGNLRLDDDNANIDTDEDIEDEIARLQRFRYEYFSVNVGNSAYKGVGSSIKKTSGTTQRQGTAYKLYGCGMLGNVDDPEILIPLETIVVLSH